MKHAIAKRAPLRFALVLTNLAGGGAEKAMLKMAALLADRGNSVDMVLLENRREHAVPDGVTVHALTVAGGISHGWVGKRIMAWKLRNRLRSGKAYDLMVSTLPFADEIADLARLPRHWCRISNTLSAEIAMLTRSNPAKAARRRKRYVRLYSRHPLIALSRGIADDLRDGLRVSSRIERLPNPFDVDAIRRAMREPAAGLPRAPYVIHVGRYAAQKRHDLLLDAWVSLPDAPPLVLLAAPDPRLTALITARGLGGRVRIAGFQANPYPWIAGAQLLVLCSDHEGLPNVLLEALACGTPVVSTNCPSGPSEILRDMPECLVPCGDVGALAKAVERTLSRRPDLSRVDFSAYHPDRVAAGWESLAD